MRRCRARRSRRFRARRAGRRRGRRSPGWTVCRTRRRSCCPRPGGGQRCRGAGAGCRRCPGPGRRRWSGRSGGSPTAGTGWRRCWPPRVPTRSWCGPRATTWPGCRTRWARPRWRACCPPRGRPRPRSRSCSPTPGRPGTGCPSRCARCWRSTRWRSTTCSPGATSRTSHCARGPSTGATTGSWRSPPRSGCAPCSPPRRSRSTGPPSKPSPSAGSRPGTGRWPPTWPRACPAGWTSASRTCPTTTTTGRTCCCSCCTPWTTRPRRSRSATSSWGSGAARRCS